MEEKIRKYYYEEIYEDGHPKFHNLSYDQKRAIEKSFGFDAYLFDYEINNLIKTIQEHFNYLKARN